MGIVKGKFKKWTKEELNYLKDCSLKTTKIAELTGRTLAATSFKRSAMGYKYVKDYATALNAGQKAAITRRLNNATNTAKPSNTKHLKFILNGVTVTVDSRVKNAHVGLDSVTVNF